MDRYAFSVPLGILVQQPLNQVNEFALVNAATAFWYSDIDLEVEIRCFLEPGRSELELRRAGYLIERLTRFPCLSDERAVIALARLPCWFPHLRQESEAGLPSSRRIDALAMSWGLLKGLGLKAQVILPYQTRHAPQIPPA
ncbi:hypothetical protein [Pseudomonas sp. MWU16-30317]|uniref:hypothetical protein n=1 Tax=Pseudomonas sp. MWU16-30317 TaxID=2878095 RepID=UPI001CFA829E|nr:hypothetical protein [Pseudomonas sp. MWU16-30317]